MSQITKEKVYSTANNYKKYHEEVILRIPQKADPTKFVYFAVFGPDVDYNLFVKQHEMVEEEWDGEKVFVVDVGREYLDCVRELDRDKPTPLMCLFNSTKDYCANILGVGLSTEDRTFFEKHPLPEKDGVPMPHTLRMVQELIEPYGLRVSRVHITPGVSITGDLLQWRSVLGVNPKAYTDRQTSNEEYKHDNPDDPDEYRLNFTSHMLRPSITCGAFISGGEDGKNFGSGGGHASYNPPRMNPGSPVMSFQIDRKENVPWIKDPVFPELEAEVEKREIVFSLDAWWEWRKKSNVSKSSGGIVGTITRFVSGKGTDKDEPKGNTLHRAHHEAYDTIFCQMCKNYEGGKVVFSTIKPLPNAGPGICDACWLDALSNVVCNHEKKECAEGYMGWTYLQHSVSELKLMCNSCSKSATLKRETFPKEVGRISTAIFRAVASLNAGTYRKIVRSSTPLPVVKGEPERSTTTGGTTLIKRADGVFDVVPAEGDFDFFGGKFPVITPEAPQQIH